MRNLHARAGIMIGMPYLMLWLRRCYLALNSNEKVFKCIFSKEWSKNIICLGNRHYCYSTESLAESTLILIESNHATNYRTALTLLLITVRSRHYSLHNISLHIHFCNYENSKPNFFFKYTCPIIWPTMRHIENPEEF